MDSLLCPRCRSQADQGPDLLAVLYLALQHQRSSHLFKQFFIPELLVKGSVKCTRKEPLSLTIPQPLESDSLTLVPA
jgi:hypothetical protein